MTLHGDIRGPHRWLTYAPDNGGFSASELGGEPYARGILVEETGAVSFIDPQGNTVTLPALVGGLIHPIPNKGIRATGTDASTVYVCF